MVGIEGEIRLEIPNVELPSDPKELEKDEFLLSLLEQSVYTWENQIGNAVDAQNHKTRKGNGPLAEIDYWKERNIGLSGIYEQAKQDKAKAILDLLSKIENPAWTSFEDRRKELVKYYNEAKDNVR